jgi:hypothetical protein
LVVATRAAALAGAGVGWWALVPARQPGLSTLVLLRFVREAINSFLPGAVIGGDMIGGQTARRPIRRHHFALGAPALLGWQALEGRRVLIAND